jgi:hypothetical protein
LVHHFTSLALMGDVSSAAPHYGELVRRRGGPQITPLADPREAEAAAASFIFLAKRLRVTNAGAETIS